ncbi:Protein-L-isoaspartate O-methyltransferase domain-containing protein 1 [Orchesella cincta]|uniref:Protein-L-isoaspartate O-methyltransferase domain-containing protein 1 n=1 Tax=Orchesella cincta TaxID=48709 RepID=A0A1D2MMK4_ORCCI|nr:Protein-L-isoaspartate O-methyltransferase domain-containing protein 1 [Orchesella cincta]
MGGAVSSGESNDDLIDNLLEADYIKTPKIERIFRAVDRAFYYTDPYKQNAYKDLAWKDGNLHLSAPCIYSEVLENLDLQPGMSFLNIGSGTGYFSTMCGLILGKYGVNHGIELYPDVVNYARTKLEEFQGMSSAIDEFEFCPPEFTVGNCLDAIAVSKRYDRIYCGAACPNDYVCNLIEMLKVGGVCVVPVGDSLLQITRVEDKKDERKVLLPVSFANLVSPKPNEPRIPIELPDWSPKSLTDLCRLEIRAALRQTIIYPEPKSLAEENRKKKRKRRQERRRASRLVVVQRQRSGRVDAEGNNGFVAIAYSMGSNSSDEERNQDVEADQNQADNISGTSSEDSHDNIDDPESKNKLDDGDAIMEEEEEKAETEDAEANVSERASVLNGEMDSPASNGNGSSAEVSSSGVAIVTGSCSLYSTVNGKSAPTYRYDSARRAERRAAGSSSYIRTNGIRSAPPTRASRTVGRTVGPESLLGRIRELVRARQHDLESMRRQFQRNSDSDNSIRSRSVSTREGEEENGDSPLNGNENADSLYSDITSSESSPIASPSSTSDDEVAGGFQADRNNKRYRNESGNSKADDKAESEKEPKRDPLLVNPCSVQMRKKILDLPLPPALKVYLNYNRKIYY